MLYVGQWCVFVRNQKNVSLSPQTPSCHLKRRNFFSLQHPEACHCLYFLTSICERETFCRDVEDLLFYQNAASVVVAPPSGLTATQWQPAQTGIVCVELCHGNQLNERRWALCIMWSNSWNISLPPASVSHICFPVCQACWERNPNYRLLLADKGQRCLRCAVKHRKRKTKPRWPHLSSESYGRVDSTKHRNTEMLDALDGPERQSACSTKRGSPLSLVLLFSLRSICTRGNKHSLCQKEIINSPTSTLHLIEVIIGETHGRDNLRLRQPR